MVEEIEHFILRLLAFLMILFIWPVAERGIKRWILFSLTLSAVFFSLSSPFAVYFFFELSLMPVAILILGWGLQPERIRAFFHLLIYTFIFSIPLFLGIVILESRSQSFAGPLLTFIIRIAFIVKTPLYLVHIWLPKAHVEAPTVGSVILAGILLKTGGIGLIWIQNYVGSNWNFLYFYRALFGRVIAAIICSFQRDLKAFVAYRRIAHINFGVMIIIFNSILGDRGRSLIILSHGFVRRLLLVIAGRCLHVGATRLVRFMRSIFLFKETFFISFASLIACNFSFPPSIGFFGELRALFIVLRSIWASAVRILFYFIFVAYYSLFLLLSTTGRENNLVPQIRMKISCLLVVICQFDLLFLRFY